MKKLKHVTIALLMAIFTIGFPFALLNSPTVQFIMKWVFIVGMFGLLVLFFYNFVKSLSEEAENEI